MNIVLLVSCRWTSVRALGAVWRRRRVSAFQTPPRRHRWRTHSPSHLPLPPPGEAAALPSPDLRGTRHKGAMAASPGETQTTGVTGGTGPVTEEAGATVGAVGGVLEEEERMAPPESFRSTRSTAPQV